MGTAYFNAFSDGYVVGEFNGIPWQKTGHKGHYGFGNPGKRLAGLDDGPNRFLMLVLGFNAGPALQQICSAGLGLHLASEDLCCIFTSFSDLITQSSFR